MSSSTLINVYKLSVWCRRYLERAGAVLQGSPDDGVEVSPLVSYAGEGLEQLCGKTLTTPLKIRQLDDIQNGAD